MKLGAALAVVFIHFAFPGAIESQGSIAGRVLSDSVRAPIPGAELIVTGATLRTVTDSAGRFVLRHVPAGKRFLVTRALGFRPDTTHVELFDDESVSRDVILKRRTITLGEVLVRDSASFSSAKLLGFNERRRASIGGHFLDSTVIAKWESRKTGDLLSTVSGIDIQRVRSSAYVIGSRAPPSLRGGATSRSAPCFMDVYVDGALVYSNSMRDIPPFDVNSIGPTHIAAIEVFSGPSNTPAQYNRASGGCGALLIWTK